MKLAPVHILLPTAALKAMPTPNAARSNATILLRSNFVRPLRVRRHSSNLVARWHVCRQSGQIECHWSLDGQSADDHLWPSPHSSKRFRHRLAYHSPQRRRSPSLVSRTCQQTYVIPI
jgi:hypothetical protein